ncbi:hypothetical protein Leryth_023070 [Lithospermum erythrorhizon]|nr:hypothetical protein Leryth_023070 [Lithospermum erythrorhizon]
MGCNVSRSEETEVVVRCRERKELIRAAANHRYHLAAAHVSYFRSLKHVGDSLRDFVDQDIASSSSTTTSLHSLDHAGGGRGLKHHDHHSEEDDDDAHLHLDLSSDEDEDHNVMRGPGQAFPPRDYYGGPFSAPSPYAQQGYWGGRDSYPQWGMPPPNINAYYMKKSSSQIRTVLQQPNPTANGYTTSYFNYPDQNGGVWGAPEAKKPQLPPPPPSPKSSVWDFFNPFDAVESGFYPQSGYGYGSIVSSPDSDEVREREGIPKLEEETESEYQKSTKGSERIKTSSREVSGPSSRSVPIQKSDASSRELPPQWDSEGHIRSSRSNSSHKLDGSSMGFPSHMSSEGSIKDVYMRNTSEGSSKQVPLLKTSEDESSKEMPSHGGQGSAIPVSSHYHDDSSITLSSEEADEITESIHHPTEENNISNPTIVKSMDGQNVNTKGVTFDLDDSSRPDFDSSKLSSLTAISVHGTRDLREVVAEIRDDFEVASSYGKEVALMLEVGKIPYRPSFIKVILSRIMFLVAPSASDLHVQSLQSVKLASKTVKLAESFFADFGEDISMKHYNLSSTLAELYAWEKKLYKEVKEEERLRIIYEKQFKGLKLLDQQGAETGKIDAAQASVRKLQTKLSISIKAINAISSKIHKLRDNKLEPQVSELIHGMTDVKSMLKCHRGRDFKPSWRAKVGTLRANTALQKRIKCPGATA